MFQIKENYKKVTEKEKGLNPFIQVYVSNRLCPSGKGFGESVVLIPLFRSMFQIITQRVNASRAYRFVLIPLFRSMFQIHYIELVKRFLRGEGLNPFIQVYVSN